MRRTRSLIALASAGVLGLGMAVVATTGAGAADNTRMLTLSTNGTLLRVIPLDDPKADRSLGNVTNFSGDDTRLVGIDVRPSNNIFYGVGNAGGVYTINSSNANIERVSQLTVPLEGDAFGVDFNPAADRLRIVSNTGQNLRHNVEGETIVDGTLAYTAGTPATGIAAAAYTNNDNDAASGTVLYDIDSTLDQLALQVPANAGTLSPVGKLGLTTNAIVGFDIRSEVVDGVTRSNTGYVALRSEATPAARFYTIDLTSGRVDKIGNFDTNVADIAIRN